MKLVATLMFNNRFIQILTCEQIKEILNNDFLHIMPLLNKVQSNDHAPTQTKLYCNGIHLPSKWDSRTNRLSGRPVQIFMFILSHTDYGWNNQIGTPFRLMRMVKACNSGNRFKIKGLRLKDTTRQFEFDWVWVDSFPWWTVLTILDYLYLTKSQLIC